VGCLRCAVRVLGAAYGDDTQMVRDAAEMLRGAQMELAYGGGTA